MLPCYVIRLVGWLKHSNLSYTVLSRAHAVVENVLCAVYALHNTPKHTQMTPDSARTPWAAVYSTLRASTVTLQR